MTTPRRCEPKLGRSLVDTLGRTDRAMWGSEPASTLAVYLASRVGVAPIGTSRAVRTLRLVTFNSFFKGPPSHLCFG